MYTYNHNIPVKTLPSSVKSVFSSTFRKELDDLMLCRRDVRNFRKDPIDQKILEKCLGSFLTAPSVGLSEPWRIVNVSSIDVRSKAIENFERCNKEALQEYNDWRARKYAKLKLSGMQDAPVHLAIYCDEGTHKGYNLGSKTMPHDSIRFPRLGQTQLAIAIVLWTRLPARTFVALRLLPWLAGHL